MKMVKVGKWIAKHRILMLIIGFLLIIPSVIGMAATKVNYDLLSYLPEHLETVKGQDILVDEYGMGAFSMVVVGKHGNEGRTETRRKIRAGKPRKRVFMV